MDSPLKVPPQLTSSSQCKLRVSDFDIRYLHQELVNSVAKTGKLIDMVIVASFPTVSEVWVQLLENYDLSISQPQEPMSYFSQDRSSSSVA